jgi:acyl-CoA synthetase (AMP-forming)/AMP-acid ligase II/acyl carrier protein
VLCGGEALPADLASKLLARAPAVCNLYGPTETTIWSTLAELTPAAPEPLIGRPIANTSTYLLDEAGGLVPLGAAGELYIGGLGLARGYLGRPELTAERFVPDPFASEPGARMYRTGDRARQRANGALEYLGRGDRQVKIRGYRVELGEVEAALLLHAEVEQAAVLAVPDPSGHQALMACIVYREGSAGDEERLRSFLASKLPEPMLPARFLSLDALPLTPNGKVDRKQLVAPASATPLASQASHVAPRTQLERQLAAIWSEVLGLERVSVEQDFFALGGHSLLAVQVLSRLREELGLELALRDLFQQSTVAELARRIEREPKPALGKDELRWISDLIDDVAGAK